MSFVMTEPGSQNVKADALPLRLLAGSSCCSFCIHLTPDWEWHYISYMDNFNPWNKFEAESLMIDRITIEFHCDWITIGLSTSAFALLTPVFKSPLVLHVGKRHRAIQRHVQGNPVIVNWRGLYIFRKPCESNELHSFWIGDIFK